MQQHLLILILLVASCSVFAHGQKFQLNKDFVTSLLAKGDAVVRQAAKNNLNLDNIVTIQTPSSAVQDWSLVCQQLCGAALGGAVCAPYCKKLSFLPYNVQFENADDIMDSKHDLICPKLCGLQLGDDVCTCKDYNTNDFDAYMKAEQQTNVCAIICDYTSVTLTGCTPCRNNRFRKTEYMILENIKNLKQQQVAPYEAVDSTKTTTTTTTPDWNQLCASLCKTGDGGSLCNCDLSPFFL